MGRVEENKKKKKEALFRTAYELFTTKGINSTAISDIVEKAGVAKGTFYLYFKDKYDIKNKLIAHKTKELFDHAAVALENSIFFLASIPIMYKKYPLYFMSAFFFILAFITLGFLYPFCSRKSIKSFSVFI